MRQLPSPLTYIAVLGLAVHFTGSASGSPLTLAQSPLLPGRSLPGPIDEGYHRTESADIDGDGLADLVIWRFGKNQVQVAYGKADGTLGLPVRLFQTNNVIFSLALAELNGDGILDAVTVTQPAVGIQPYLSSGGEWHAGTASPWFFESWAIGTEFRLADVNGDGELDLFARSPVSQTGGPEVALGLGGGVFGPRTYVVRGTWPAPVYDFADLNSDGVLDLVATGYTTAAGVHPAAVIYGTGSLPLLADRTVLIGAPEPVARFRDLAIMDEEGDGDLDLFLLARKVAATGVQGREVLIANQGPGSVFTGVSVATDTIYNADRILGVDAEGDGDMDLVLMQPYPRTSPSAPFWFVVRGPQSYGNALPAASVQGLPYFASVADIDGDGMAEVASGLTLMDDPATPLSEAGPVILHHEFSVAGTFIELADSPINEEVAGPPLAVLPFREGELPVLFTDDPWSNRWFYKPNLGENRFGGGIEIPAMRGRASSGFVVGDIDADGNNDLVFREFSGVWFDVLASFGDGAGNFSAPVTILNTMDAFGNPVELIDIDADGDLDLSFSSVAFLANEHHAAFNDGTGQFSPSSPLFPGTQFRRYGTFADLNADGLLDILIPRVGGFELALGLGGSDFASPIPLLLNGAYSNVLSISDFTGDGVNDLLLEETALIGAPAPVVLAGGVGDGTFVAAVPVVSLPMAGTYLHSADVDLDGDLDILYVDRNSNRIVVLEGNGQGSFAAPQATSTQTALRGSAGVNPFVDTDLDGDLDFIGVAFEGNPSWITRIEFIENGLIGQVGSTYCSSTVPNSTGLAASLSGYGRASVSANMLRLDVVDLPPSSTTLILTSQTQGLVTSVAGSVGTLCLYGSIGRFVGPGQVQNSGIAGAVSVNVDLTAMPDPMFGLIAAQAGETWSFQAWHRDFVAGTGITSNFSAAIEVLMR